MSILNRIAKTIAATFVTILDEIRKVQKKDERQAQSSAEGDSEGRI